MRDRILGMGSLAMLVGMSVLLGALVIVPSEVRASWSWLPDAIDDPLMYQGGPIYQRVTTEDPTLIYSLRGGEYEYWTCLDADTGLHQFSTQYSMPAYDNYHHLLPYTLNMGPYYYVDSYEYIEAGYFTGYRECRFGIAEPVNVTNEYEYMGFSICWKAYFSNQFSASSYYLFSVITPSGEVVSCPTYSAYSVSAGQWNTEQQTAKQYFNNSPDTGQAWTAEEIGQLTFRIIVYSHTEVVEEYKIDHIFLGLYEQPAPEPADTDLILRPDGVYYSGGWESYPTEYELSDAVNETETFGDGDDTYIWTDSDGDALAFTFDNLPAAYINQYFVAEIWIVAKAIAYDPPAYFWLAPMPSDAGWYDPQYLSDNSEPIGLGYMNLTWEYLLNPYTSEPWTFQALNDLVLFITSTGSEVRITQVGIALTLTTAFDPGDLEPSDWSIIDMQRWLADGGVSWIFLALGGFLMIAAPAAAVIAYREDGYIESFAQFVILGALGFGLATAGLLT